MKRLALLFLLIVTSLFAQAQVATDIYWVQFTDKNNSPYSIDNPEAYLSPRALERRARQGIGIDEYDIPVNPQYLQAVAAYGAEILNPTKWLNGVTIHTTDASVIDAINALEFVSAIRNCPNNPKAQERKMRWLENEMKAAESVRGLYDYYGEGSTQLTQLNTQVLHNMGYRGEGMVIAILDGGFSGADIHSCFDNMREEGRLLGTRDFVYGSTTVYAQSQHGTSCLSTMAAFVPNTFVGTAPKASYYLIHTEDVQTENIVEEYNWVSGAEYADSLGVDVCTTSLGYIDFDMPEWDHPFAHFDGHTAPMTIGSEIAASRGILCFNSAGNEGDSWNGECTLGIPADAEHILTVGAVEDNGQRAWFSSVGPTFDGRIKPDVMAMGQSDFVASSDGGYYHGSGTSFACPVMAGAVTCLWQANPTASASEIRDAVRQCGNHASNPDVQYGYGIPNLENAFNTLHVEDTFTSKNEIISVFPNPSQGEAHITMKEGYYADLSVYDLMGRLLKAYHFNGLNHTTIELFLNNLSNGVYFIKADSERGSQTLKLIIAR